MEVVSTKIEGVVELKPKLIEDDRGYFFESFSKKKLPEWMQRYDFVQDNQSFSHKGVLRGIHYQTHPKAQAKLVRVIKGKVLDVAVDLRKDSPTFTQSVGVILDDQSHNMLFIPEGFGHGFYTIEDTILSYKCSEYYSPEHDGGVRWNDPDLNIDWGDNQPELSSKDKNLPYLGEIAPF